MLDQAIDVGVIKLGYRSAFPANQKLTGVGPSGIRAADIRIDRIQPVYQIGFDQKIQRPIDCRWRRLFTIAVDSIEDIVGADWLVAVPDEFKNTAAYSRES